MGKDEGVRESRIFSFELFGKQYAWYDFKPWGTHQFRNIKAGIVLHSSYVNEKLDESYIELRGRRLSPQQTIGLYNLYSLFETLKSLWDVVEQEEIGEFVSKKGAI